MNIFSGALTILVNGGTLPEGRRPSRHPGPLMGTLGNVTFYSVPQDARTGRLEVIR